ncbi:MAG: enoyl-CoA hydratase-related protein [Acidimicrobiales bacterium]
MSDEPAPVLLDTIAPGIARITMNRPASLNSMNRALIDGLHDALDAIDADTSTRVVVLTGAGRGFCAGLDLRDPTLLLGGNDPEGPGVPQSGMALQQRIASLIPKLRRLRVPVISAINGPATGGGLALALGSDVRIAAESAKFGVAFIRIGLSACDIGVSWALPRLVGASRAHELMLTGRVFDAAEADRIGLVTSVVPDADLLDAALHTAGLIAANSPFGVWMTKEVMWSNLETPSQQAAIDLENRTQILSSFTEDVGEAVGAFFEKRPPVYRNR